MAAPDLLHTFLSFHIANDSTAAHHLPLVISGLSPQSIESSQNLPKWTNRVNALIHARDSGARWSGLCLALETSRHSRSFLMGSAQTWITVVLPMLSRIESLAVWRAAIKLLCFIFTSTSGLPEFQRQTATPNVPKFSSALVSLAEKHTDDELKAMCLDILSIVVPLYPTLHRQLHVPLSTVSLKLLNGSASSTPVRIMTSACRLHACLHSTGGKVGATGLWRKSLDETIEFCTTALSSLRATTLSNGHTTADSLQSVSLQLDRLQCGIELICSLLRSSVSRPVSVPVRALVDLSVDILKSTGKEEKSSSSENSMRSLDISAIACMLNVGCRLLDCLSRCVQRRLSPHLTRILAVIAYYLEQKTPIRQRLPFVRVLPSILDYCPPPCDPLIAGRILKTILPTLTLLLPHRGSEEVKWSSQDAGSKKGKKRARGFEGDDVFKSGPEVLCKTAEDGIMVLAVLDAVPALLRIPGLPAYLQSISSRALLSILLALPEQPASLIAHDLTLKGEILMKVKLLCTQLATGTSSVLSKTLPLVVHAISSAEDQPQPSEIKMLIDLMLHPRLPPLLRSLPPLDTIALSSVEEGTDERETRQSLGLRTGDDNSMQVDGPQSDSIFVPQTSELQPATSVVGPGTSSSTPLADPSAALTRSAWPIPTNPQLLFQEATAPNPSANRSNTPFPSDTPLIPSGRHAGIAHLDKPVIPQGKSEQNTPQKANTFDPAAVDMTVDDEDDGEIEVPALDMDSDSDQEE